jgi:hypothetical protein
MALATERRAFQVALPDTSLVSDEHESVSRLGMHKALDFGSATIQLAARDTLSRSLRSNRGLRRSNKSDQRPLSERSANAPLHTEYHLCAVLVLTTDLS